MARAGAARSSPLERYSARPVARRSLVALLAGAALAVLVGCSARTPPAAGPSASVAQWYQLQQGRFQPVSHPTAATEVPARAWTVQARVADMAFLGDDLYCAVNGAGLASLSFDATGAPVFAYFPDPLIFGHRTVTAMVPRQGTLAVHIYFNVLLNDVRPQELPLGGISIVTFLPGQSNYSFLVPPFQRRNVEWEAVGFAAESENSFDMEWKFTDAAETRFAYTRFHADTRAEETVTRATYLAALGVPDIAGAAVPTDLAAFFQACRARIPGLGADTALQFSLRSRESPVRRNYRSRPESDAAVTVPVFEQAGARHALLPDGTVLSSVPSAELATLALPALPAGFRYTDIVKAGSVLVVPWEETSFTDVQRAGLLLLRQR